MPSGFRHGSSASARYDFADDQPWLPIGRGEFSIPCIPFLRGNYNNCIASWHAVGSLGLPVLVADPAHSGLQVCR